MIKKNVVIFIIIFIVLILVLTSYKFGMISAEVSLTISVLLIGIMHIHVGFFLALREKNIFNYFQLFFTTIMGLFFLILGWGFFQKYI